MKHRHLLCAEDVLLEIILRHYFEFSGCIGEACKRLSMERSRKESVMSLGNGIEFAEDLILAIHAALTPEKTMDLRTFTQNLMRTCGVDDILAVVPRTTKEVTTLDFF